MKILEFGFRNFNSYGNDWTTFSFDATEHSLNLISGKNGTGKSTVMEALTFAIYGKVKGKNIPNLANRHNQNLETFVVILNNNGQLLKIKRGIAPNYFTFHVDGSPFDKAGKISLQKIIESEYIGISLEVFTNIISLSIDKFKSFLNMKKGDKIDITDKVCNTSHFNVMQSKVKDDIKVFKSSISSLEAKLDTYNEEIEGLDSQINETESDSVRNDRILELKESIDGLKENIDIDKSFKDSLEEKITAISNQVVTLKKIVKDDTNKVNLYEKGFCTKCKAVHEIDKDELTEMKEQLAFNKIAFDNVVNLSIEKQNEYTDLLNSIKSFTEDREDLQEELNKLNSEQNTGLTILTNKSNEFKAKVKVIESDLVTQREDLNECLILSDLLSEKGLKQIVMKSLSPLITNESNKILQILKLKYTIDWDEFSNITLYENYIEIDNTTLSTGETKKVDFGILIGLIKVLKLNYPNINILFIDEIFASIDVNSIDSLMQIVGDLTKTLKINCFIMHHSSLQLEDFDRVYSTMKINGYSMLK